MKATFGPWAWQLFGDTYMLAAQHGRREIIIGAIPHRDMKYPVVAMNQDGRLQDVDPLLPNAKLIAAAPELLYATSQLLICLNNTSLPWNSDPAMNKAIEYAQKICKKLMDE